MSTLGQELRLFTVAEAQSMLPLVRSIVRGIVEDHSQLQQRIVEARMQHHEPSAGARDPSPARRSPAPHATESGEDAELKSRVEEAVAELAALGVEFKDFDLGLVDFPARRGQEVVHLCWKHGEERISYWHPLEEGLAGRRDLDEMVE
ncbi:MAG: DUF2203 domain-containing protein [Gemmatimonadetes bacterium]|nr:DUF2203 domain-containing protein [Gemmatimonadota bacterium]